MPTYEYLCQTCSHRFEIWQKMADEPLTVCPSCGEYIQRVFYATGVIFKGSGFYKTDYRSSHGSAAPSDGQKADEKASESKPGTNETAKEASGESKTASATASAPSS